MTMLPIGPWPILVALALVGMALIWWPAPEGVVELPTTTRGVRSAMVVLLLGAALRPGVPGQFVNASATNLNAYFVVDTTSSMIARDYGGRAPRLDGVKDDIQAIVAKLPGARFSLVTFDRTVKVRMPLSTDSLALDAAANTLLVEPNEYSQGSSVTVAGPALTELLTTAKQKYPDRGRIVFYFGDGEQTSGTAPSPMAVPAGLIQGGAVFGYGTSEGGPMADTRSRYRSGTPTDIVDPSTGKAARSVLDEKNLKAIAQELGIPYVHRSAGDSADALVAGVDLAQFGTSEEEEKAKVRNRTEFYWLFLLALMPLAAWEGGHALAAYRSSRPPRTPRPGSQPGSLPGSRRGQRPGSRSAPPSPASGPPPGGTP